MRSKAGSNPNDVVLDQEGLLGSNVHEEGDARNPCLPDPHVYVVCWDPTRGRHNQNKDTPATSRAS